MELNPAIIQDIKQGLNSKFQTVIVDAYRAMKADSSYKLSFEEDDFTAILKDYMEKLTSVKNNQISIYLRSTIIEDIAKIKSGESKIRNAAIIDIEFSIWQGSDKVKYYAEAKNLSETDWIKSGNQRVNSSYYKNRYITSGINSFRDRKYVNGCLLGYIVQGSLNNIVRDINHLLSSNSRTSEVLVGRVHVSSHPHCYYSLHDCGDSTKIELLHLLLPFN